MRKQKDPERKNILMENEWDYELFKNIFDNQININEAYNNFISYIQHNYSRFTLDGKYLCVRSIDNNEYNKLFNDDHENGEYLFEMSRINAYERMKLLKTMMDNNNSKFKFNIIDMEPISDEVVVDQVLLQLYDKSKPKFIRKVESTIKSSYMKIRYSKIIKHLDGMITRTRYID